MSIYASGVRSRSCGEISAIAKRLKSLNLQPVKKIDITFDPFSESAKSTREFFFHVTTKKVVATNPYCWVKPIIVCDRSEPTIAFNLTSGDKVLLKTSNLSSLNILDLYIKHIASTIPLDPAEIAAQEEAKAKAKKRSKRRIKFLPLSKRRRVILHC